MTSSRGSRVQEKKLSPEGTERRHGERGDFLQKYGVFPLAEIGDFFVQMGEGSFEGLAMVGMSGGREVVGDTDAR